MPTAASSAAFAMCASRPNHHVMIENSRNKQVTVSRDDVGRRGLRRRPTSSLKDTANGQFQSRKNDDKRKSPTCLIPAHDGRHYTIYVPAHVPARGGTCAGHAAHDQKGRHMCRVCRCARQLCPTPAPPLHRHLSAGGKERTAQVPPRGCPLPRTMAV